MELYGVDYETYEEIPEVYSTLLWFVSSILCRLMSGQLSEPSSKRRVLSVSRLSPTTTSLAHKWNRLFQTRVREVLRWQVTTRYVSPPLMLTSLLLTLLSASFLIIHDDSIFLFLAPQGNRFCYKTSQVQSRTRHPLLLQALPQ